MTNTLSSRRARIARLFALLLAVGMTLLIAHVAQRLSALVDALAHDHARAVAANVAALTQAAVATNDRIALAARLESFNEFGAVRSILVTDRQGVPLAAVRRNAAGNLSATPGRELVGGDDEGTQRPTPAPWQPGGKATPSIRMAIGPIAPIGWVHLHYDVEPAETARQRLVAGAMLVALLLVAALTTVFALALRRLLQGDPDNTPPPAHPQGHADGHSG